MVLDTKLRCVAVNATLLALRRQTLDEGTLGLPGNDFSIEIVARTQNDAEFANALTRCLAGEFVALETANPPGLYFGEGQWKLYFLPFIVENERGITLFFEDITEQRITNEAFQAAEQRFRLLVDAAADGIVIFRSQILLYVNLEAVNLLGYQSPDELVGRPLGDLVDAGHRPSFDANLNELESSQGAGVFETAFVRRDDVSFPVECRVSHTRVDDMGAGFLFFRNIADRKRQQSRRENAKRVESLAQLSTSVGTELQGFTNRLRRLATRIKGTLEERETVGLELMQLTNELAERARQFVLSGAATVTVAEATPLEELLGRVCSKLTQTQTKGALEPPDALSGRPSDVHIDLEPVEYAVRGDPTSIERSLVTLALAAWRSRTRSAPLRIRGAKSMKTDRDAWLGYRLSIIGGDTQIRQSGATAASSTFPPTASPFGSWEKGHDLELLEAFATLQAQGCWVETQQGVRGGLCFEIELTLDPSRSVSFDSVPPPQARPGGSGQLPVETREQKPATRRNDERSPDTERSLAAHSQPTNRGFPPILICDDEPRLVALTAGLLREFGFEVLTVRSGIDAIKTARTQPVDLVVLDVNLPGEDAREIVVELQRNAPVSIILSSGYTEEDVDPLLLREPAVKAFLSKPYTVDVLVQTIDRVRTETPERQTSNTP